MSGAAHTPGPWRWSVGNGYNSQVYVFRGEDEICEVFNDCDTEALPDRANAALIAAAPEMLSALHLIGMSAGWQYLSYETRDIIEAVIAKAEGRS